MKILTKALILSVFTFIFSGSSIQASHILGGDLSYIHEPLPNSPYRFRVVLQYYRYCGGIAVPNSLSLNVAPVQPCAGATALPPINMQRNSGLFPTVMHFPLYSNYSAPASTVGFNYYKRKVPGYNTTCGFSVNPPASLVNDVIFYEYQAYVIIPQNMRCDQWLFWTSECCRNPVTNVSPASTSVVNEAMVNTNFLSPADIANGMRQNSPRFITLPIQQFPVNQRSFISPSADEKDGDSLSLSFATIKLQPQGSTVSYVGLGVSNSAPVQPFPINSFQPNGLPQIDRASGMISFVPSLVNRFAAVIQCDEWRRVNNIPVRVGYVRRDLELNFYAGNLPFLNTLNQSPTIKNMAGDFDAPTPTGTTVDFEKYRIDAPVCQSTCFTLEAKDFDIFDEVQLFATDSFGAIPSFRLPAILNATSTRFPNPVNPKLQICINPEGSALRNHPYLLHVNVSDDFAYAGETSYTIKIYVTDGGFAQVGPDITVCNGAPTSLTALGGLPGATYQWWPSSGLSDSTVQFPLYTPATNPQDSLTFSVRITQPSGCVSENKLTVFQRDSLDLSINDGADTLIKCPGIDLQLSAVGATQYSWTPTAGLSDPTVANPIANPLQNTLYTVTGASGSCIASASVMIVVDSLIQPVVPNSMGMCEGDSAQLTASGASEYSWSPLTNISGANSCCPTINPSVSTAYVLRSSSVGGCTYYDTVHVKVGPNVAPRLTIPSVLEFCAGDSISIKNNLMMSMPTAHPAALSCGSSIDELILNSSTTTTMVGNTTGIEPSDFLFTKTQQFNGAYQHILIRAADLQQSGLKSGFIKKISFIVLDKTSGLDTAILTISMKCKPANHSFTSYPGMGVLMETGFKDLFSGLQPIKQAINEIELAELFPWDGVSSLLLRFCASSLFPNSNQDFFAKLAITQTTYTATASDPSLFVNVSCNTTLYSPNSFNRRPVFGFEMISSAIPGDFQYNWTNTFNSVGLSHSQANALVSFTDTLQTGAVLNYSDTGVFSYNIHAQHILGCSSDSTTIQIRLNPVIQPSNLNSQSVCSGTNVSLDANGQSYAQWFADSSLTEWIGVGSPLLYGPILSPKTVYAVLDSMVESQYPLGISPLDPGTPQTFQGLGQIKSEHISLYKPAFLGSIDINVIQAFNSVVSIKLLKVNGTPVKEVTMNLLSTGLATINFDTYLPAGEYVLRAQLISNASLRVIQANSSLMDRFQIQGAIQLHSPNTMFFNWQVRFPKGCAAPSPLQINVANIPPQASAQYSVINKTVYFNNTSQSASSFNWNFGDAVGISSAPSPSYTYANYGTYTVSMRANGLCGPADSTTWTINLVNPLGIADQDRNLGVEIYPNPVNTFLTIKAQGSFTYELWSITGVLVTKGTSGEEILELDVQTILPGAYVLKISKMEGILIKQILKH